MLEYDFKTVCIGSFSYIQYAIFTHVSTAHHSYLLHNMDSDLVEQTCKLRAH